LSGTDIDPQAIAWCQRHLSYARTLVNPHLPPLPFDAASFDAIYAISVFTHLNEEMQLQWLAELRRVLTPEGVLLVTLLGGGEGLTNAGNLNWRGTFPSWYQDTLHSEDYVRKTFAQWFRVVAYVPKGMNAHQDVVLLRPV
ncbi:MAG: class I SAM-dependent methyltransferase, partial [Deltaproteobacteria bacterium]|nr:class I SAM-dependent methyltransferase [Deltaproteobacteria bacterium]